MGDRSWEFSNPYLPFPNPLKMLSVSFENISKHFGKAVAVDGVSLEIRAGELFFLLGPSGCGKTTCLRMVAGFEQPTTGVLRFGDKEMTRVPPHKRNAGMVFQNYALWPHMTAKANIEYGLRVRKIDKKERERRVNEALEMVKLGALGERFPSQMSGGQQQRVALSRALVFEPRVVLMDEPLGALDKQLREQMQLDIRDLHRRLGLTIVFVTHDQSEALTMSDRLAVFNKGKIEQIGTPREVYDEPASRFVAEFIGETNLVEGVVEAVQGQEAIVRLSTGAQIVSVISGTVASGQPVLLSIRPERVDLSETRGDARNVLETEVTDSVYQGDHLRVQLQNVAHPLIAKLGRRSREFPPGTKVYAAFSAGDCRVIAP